MDLYLANSIVSPSRLGREQRIMVIVSIIGRAAQVLNRGFQTIANRITSAILERIQSDPSIWQVLSIVYLGGTEGNTNSLKGPTGPIYPSVLPAHEDDEILARAKVTQDRKFCLTSPDQRRATLEHSFFICSVPVLLAAIASIFAGSFFSRDSHLIGSNSSGSQNTISANMGKAYSDSVSLHSAMRITDIQSPTLPEIRLSPLTRHRLQI